MLFVRDQLNDFLKDAMSALQGGNLKPQILDLLEAYGLWAGSSAAKKQRLGRLVGGANKRDVFGLPLSRAGLLTGDKTFGNKGHVLIVPAYDMPGRPRSLRLVASGGEESKEINIRPGGETTYFDDGLVFLDLIDMQSDIIYATHSLLAALQLQMRRLVHSDDPVPIVVYGPNTSTAWDCLKAKRIIFWDPLLLEATFKHAVRVDGYISAVPKAFTVASTPRQIVENIRKRPELDTLGRIEQHQLHWAEQLKNFMLDNPARGAAMVDRIGLDTTKQTRVLDFCTPAEKPLIRQILDDGKIGLFFEYDGKYLMETNEGYFERLKTMIGEQHRVTDFRIVPKVNVVYKRKGIIKTRGYILKDSQQIEFFEDRNVIEKDPYKWVESVVLAAGLSQPIVAPKYKKKLFSLALSRYRPVTRHALERVGWDGDRLLFPTFFIKDGDVKALEEKEGDEVKVARTVALQAALPLKLLEDLCRDDAAVAGFWALFACLVRNLLAPKKGWGILPIGFVCETEDHKMAKWFADAFDLPRARLGRNMKLESIMPDTDFPTLLHVSELAVKPITDMVEEQGEYNAIVPVSETFARFGSLHRSMLFVRPQDRTYKFHYLKGAQNILPHYIAWLQADGYAMSDREEPLLAVLRNLHLWADVKHKLGEKMDGLNAAEDILYGVRGGSSAAPIGRQFIDLLIWLSDSGVLDKPKMDDKTVSIDLPSLRALKRSTMCPEVPMERVVDSLTKMKALSKVSGDRTLAIKRGFWDYRGGDTSEVK